MLGDYLDILFRKPYKYAAGYGETKKPAEAGEVGDLVVIDCRGFFIPRA